MLPCRLGITKVLYFHLFVALYITKQSFSLSTLQVHLDSFPDRRSVVESIVAVNAGIPFLKDSPSNGDNSALLQVVTDPNTYSALAYESVVKNEKSERKPLIVVLHGAGRQNKDILSDLGDPNGEHAGLIPSLIAANEAPKELTENFSVLAPYAFGKTSFYQDSRSTLLQFVDWAKKNQGTESCPITFDPNRIILFGFSDGATVAVELLTTRRFIGGVICSYGFSGQTLPKQALDRLSNVPMWIFHSADDVIFDVKNSDRLYNQLLSVTLSNLLKYSRFDQDPEHLPKRVQGHSMGITASKSSQVYEWMLTLQPLT